jgi:hypothetical protein
MVTERRPIAAIKYIDLAVRISLIGFAVGLALTGIILSTFDITLHSSPAWPGYLAVAMTLIAATSVVARWYSSKELVEGSVPAAVLAWFAFFVGTWEPRKPGMWMAAIVILMGWSHSIYSWKIRRWDQKSARMSSRKKM